MTIDEAIRELRLVKAGFINYDKQAVDMGIASLEAWHDIVHEISQEDMLCHHNKDEQKMLDWARWLVKTEIKDIENGKIQKKYDTEEPPHGILKRDGRSA